tara:strand:+ start:104 stop:367 length:264 start_codon:yes stop_codon:yes gene_type:complete
MSSNDCFTICPIIFIIVFLIVTIKEEFFEDIHWYEFIKTILMICMINIILVLCLFIMKKLQEKHFKVSPINEEQNIEITVPPDGVHS